MALLCCLLLVPFQQLVHAQSDDFPVITTPSGTMMGRKIYPFDGDPYYNFLGIPYGEPPVGDLRFKAPVPFGAWNSSLIAIIEGSICTQLGTGGVLGDDTGGVSGSEDCLFLNVFVPQLPGSGSLLPVMVWIHGGGWMSGSGNPNIEGPQYLVSEGIVYVSLNYRLGALGFLSTGDEVIPGNAGMKDQALALRWVQENIEAFGGDPNKVTIFGESAGASNVHLHYFSPMSAGLFQGGIAQSGSAVVGFPLTPNPRDAAFELGNALGFSGNTSLELAEFLRNVSAVELLTAVQGMGQNVLLSPVVEPVVEGETAFLTDDPLRLLNEGNFTKVPFLTGVNSAEGMFFLTAFDAINNSSRRDEVIENLGTLFQGDMTYCSGGVSYDTLISEIKSFYFGHQPENNNTLGALIDFVTDAMFANPTIAGIERMSELSSEPVYFYEFTYDGGLNYVKVKGRPQLANIPGTSHADDLGYIFDVGLLAPEDSSDATVRSRMVTLWTNFAKTGNPTPEVSDDIPAWLPFTNSSRNYLDIGSQLIPKTDYSKSRMDFWHDSCGFN